MTHTRAEILAMPAKQLLKAILTRRGWTVTSRIIPGISGDVLFELWHKGNENTQGVSFNEKHVWKFAPDPTANIADAWELVEEMHRAGCVVVVVCNPAEGNDFCHVNPLSSLPLIAMYGVTILLAISRAWLLWDVTREGNDAE